MPTTEDSTKTYRVAYIGFPKSKTRINAHSAKEAAYQFFDQDMKKNTVLVEWGFSGMDTFPFSLFETDIPELKDTDIELEVLKVKPYDSNKDPRIKYMRCFHLLVATFGFVYMAVALYPNASYPESTLLEIAMCFCIAYALLFAFLPASWVAAFSSIRGRRY